MAKRDKTDRILGNFRGKPKAHTPEMILPNTSGDHVRGIKRLDPFNDYDLANKKYVDDKTVAHADTTGQTANDHHNESHTVASHSDTTATGAELNTLTDNSVANTLHRHSELVASDGAPDPALSVDADGDVGIGTTSPAAKLQVVGTTTLGSASGGTNNQVQVSAVGDTVFVDGAGVPFGGYYGVGINWSQANAVQNTWYHISDSDMGNGQLHMFTHDGSGQLTATYSGKYYIFYTVCFEVDQANDHIEAGLSIDGNAPSSNRAINVLETPAANMEVQLAGCTMLNINASSTIDLRIRTTDNNTPTITVHNVNFITLQVGGVN